MRKNINIEELKANTKEELKQFEKDNGHLLEGFTQKERILILYYLVAERGHDIDRNRKTINLLFWLVVFVNIELLLVSIFGR